MAFNGFARINSTFLIIFSTGAKTSTFAELVKKMEAMQRMTQTKAVVPML